MGPFTFWIMSGCCFSCQGPPAYLNCSAAFYMGHLFVLGFGADLETCWCVFHQRLSQLTSDQHVKHAPETRTSVDFKDGHSRHLLKVPLAFFGVGVHRWRRAVSRALRRLSFGSSPRNQAMATAPIDDDCEDRLQGLTMASLRFQPEEPMCSGWS